MKKSSARQWTLTLRFIDAFALTLILSIAWVTYSRYRSGTEFRWPLSWSGVLYLALIPVIRGIAVRERKKSEEAERAPHDVGAAPRRDSSMRFGEMQKQSSQEWSALIRIFDPFMFCLALGPVIAALQCYYQSKPAAAAWLVAAGLVVAAWFWIRSVARRKREEARIVEAAAPQE